jgi:hypothetical protein
MVVLPAGVALVFLYTLRASRSSGSMAIVVFCYDLRLRLLMTTRTLVFDLCKFSRRDDVVIEEGRVLKLCAQCNVKM